MAASKRLFLIDGYSTIFRAFYAIRNLSSSSGQPTNALYGFIQMLRKLLRDHEPEYVGIALDVSRKTVRSEKYPEYKANRSPTPDDLKIQIPAIRRVIEAFGIPILELQDYEADDVLGTIAKRASAVGHEVVLVTADKDLMQLVDDKVSLYHTGREKLYGPELVEEDFGVPPHQVRDVLALMGDSVDNVPGVPGIGAKGAKNLISEFGTLEKLLDSADEISRKAYRTGLTEHRDDALLSQDLVTIYVDLPLEYEEDRFALGDPDLEALAELFREHDFFSLLKEMEIEGVGARKIELREAKEPADASALQVFDDASPLYAAVIGSEQDHGDVCGLALASDETEPLYVDFRREGLEASALEWLRAALSREDLVVVGHDTKELLRLYGKDRPVLNATLWDTMMAAYLLRSSSRTFGLAEVVLDRLGYQVTPPKEAGFDKGEMPSTGSDELLGFVSQRVELPRLLREVLEEELDQPPIHGRDPRSVFEELEIPLQPVLVAMEECGIALDVSFLEGMSQSLGEQLDELEASIYEIAGEEFNINSPSQLGVILFEKLGYPVIKRTRKTKSYSTGSDTLEALAAQGFDLPDLILRFRELSKLKSTYVDALPQLLAADERLHTRFQQAVAATGRLSSAHPNLQNIPVRSEVGQQIRRAFVPSAGSMLVVADYSQIELRLLAHIAQEEALLEAFRSGDDIHRSTAASVFGVALDLVTDEQRRAAKTINFGIIYGMSAFGLAQNLGIARGEAKTFIDAYFERFPGVSTYTNDTIATAEENECVTTLFGRVRWLPDIKSRNRALRENARRMAVNARIQGTAADLLKKAMIQVDARLRSELDEAKLLLTVHDELVFEVPAARASELGELVRSEMEGVAELSVPLVVDVGIGPNWYESKA